MINLHNHSTFSDGAHKPEAMVKAAVKEGLKVFGLSDHYETLKIPGRSLPPEKLEDYLSHLEGLRQKYKGKIAFKVGLEIDFCLVRTDFTRFPWSLTSSLDYVLLEYVEEEPWGGLGLREALRLRERFACKVGIAHNDLQENFGEARYEEVASSLSDHDIFLELCPTPRNSRGMTPYYYYCEPFFEYADKYGVKFSIGTDTHINPREVGEVRNALSFLEQLGLTDRLVFSDGG